MRKILCSLLILSLTFMSCMETQKSQIEKQAIEAFKSFYNTEKDAEFVNIETVFSTENLCIIHADVKNVVPNKVEYLYLLQDGKFYEAFRDLNKDSIYVCESTLKEIGKGTIYENLGFEEAIFYRAALYINNVGREVGNHNTDFFIHIPIETGLWEICDVVDEFGDMVSRDCLRLTGKGTFSNDYKTNESLIALLFVDIFNNISLRLIENGKKVVEEVGDLKIKDCEGGIHKIYFSKTSSGEFEPYSIERKMELREIIQKEGEITAIAEVGGGLFPSGKTTYKFKFKLDGLKKAMRYIQPSKVSETDQDEELESDYDELDSGMESESVNEEDIKFSIPESESMNEVDLDNESDKNKDDEIE